MSKKNGLLLHRTFKKKFGHIPSNLEARISVGISPQFSGRFIVVQTFASILICLFPLIILPEMFCFLDIPILSYRSWNLPNLGKIHLRLFQLASMLGKRLKKRNICTSKEKVRSDYLLCRLPSVVIETQLIFSCFE